MYKKKQKNVKKPRRTFNTRMIRAKQTYSTDEIAALLDVHLGTIHAWHKGGLPSIDAHKQLLFWGQDIKDFINRRQQDRKRPCKPDELFCFKCQKPRTPRDRTICIKVTATRTKIAGFCQICSTPMNKSIAPNMIDFFKGIFTIQTVHAENLLGCTNTCAISNQNQGDNHGQI